MHPSNLCHDLYRSIVREHAYAKEMDVVTPNMPPLSLHRSSGSFREVKQSDAENALHEVFMGMRLAVPESERQEALIDEDTFFSLYRSLLDEKRESIDWSLIKQPEESVMSNYEDFPKPKEADMVDALSKLVVIKLNGGLGTSMGCCGPKSLIKVRDDCTFLDLTVQQIEPLSEPVSGLMRGMDEDVEYLRRTYYTGSSQPYLALMKIRRHDDQEWAQTLNLRYGIEVPLVLMNSFNTQRDTDSYLRKISKRDLKIFTFEQNRFPRLLEETSLPFAKSMQLKQDYDPAWYPPGHGDLYRCFYESGLLKKFINEGKTWAFVSNIDNLGATADPTILCYLEEQRKNKTSKQADFVMEVTPKTLSDIKGGTLVRYKERLRLLEVAQVPPEHMDDFLSVRKFNIFNTNNLWVNLESLYNALLTKRLQMDLIINRKTLPDGMRIIQLEEASGAAIKSFERPMGLRVPRSRFLPVKVTSDLMLLMSDLYIWRAGQLLPSPLRNFPTLPIVKLGKHFEKMRDFEKHMSKVPSMIELYHLTVSGNVTFGKDVVLKGTVIIIAQDNEQIDIPNGSVLENKVITGNLRIVNH